MPIGEPMNAEPVEHYRPLPSLGWLWVLALAIAMVVPMTAALFAEPIPAEALAIIIGTYALIGVIVVWFLVTIAFFPRMRYDLTSDALVITYGPILRYALPYASITDVRIENLRFSPWSSFRFPGLALWKVQYGGGIGIVKMCSTRSHRGVVLIAAGGERYGISPDEQDRFIHELDSRRSRAREGGR
ncbi:MAG: hypothetical protein FD171_2070 [Actinobacteria bacterium]|nr:MAG: hypothetical protein FD171_2070 [Actinomycetota bacterium]